MALPTTKLGRHIQGQLIRCSTSVAANYRATCVAQTKNVFVTKISIVIEEADESTFWFEFIVDENLLKEGISATAIKRSQRINIDILFHPERPLKRI